jgi:nucleoside-diphosphate kinase
MAEAAADTHDGSISNSMALLDVSLKPDWSSTLPPAFTLFIIKNDAIARGLTGTVLGAIERKGFSILHMTMVTPTTTLLSQHYAEHAQKPFFLPMVAAMTGQPVVVVVAQINDEYAQMSHDMQVTAGRSVVQLVRETYAPNPKTYRNLIHASDSVDAAVRELNLWMKL